MTSRETYKGNELIVLKRRYDDKYPFSFGLSKARLILENLADIEEFVEEGSEQKQGERNRRSNNDDDYMPF